MSKLDFFTLFDLLGPGFQFNVNSNDTIKTTLGGFLSFFIFIASIILFIIFGENYFYKTDPNGYFQIIQDKGGLNLTNKPFLAGFQIYDDDFNVFPMEENFHAFFVYRRINKTNGEFYSNRTLLNSIPCNKLETNYFHENNFDLSKFLCPDFPKNLDLHGNFDSESLSVLEFFISKCDFNNSNCKNTKKILQLDKGKRKWISSIIPDVSYNINNFTNPFETKLHNHFHFISTNKYVYQEFHFSKYESDTDDGDFYKRIKTEKSLGVKKTYTSDYVYVDTLDESDIKKGIDFTQNAFYKGVIFYDDHKAYYSRWYMKIPDIVACTVGILN